MFSDMTGQNLSGLATTTAPIQSEGTKGKDEENRDSPRDTKYQT